MRKVVLLLFLLAIAWNTMAQLNQSLVTPNPSAEAKALYKFLLDNYGKKTISGVMTLNSMDEVNWLKQNTGKEPALVGIDFMHTNRGYTWYNNRTPYNDALTYYNRNGIPSMMWHWRDPSRRTEEFYADKTTFDANKIFDPSSAEYQAMISDIDFIAGQFKDLQAQKVAILWRPLHEAGGGWFWWGSKGGAACKKIWQVMFDRMVNYHGLRNLIWVWTKEPNDSAFYPGDAYVDIVGRDYYKTGDHSSQLAEYNSVFNTYGGKKMTTISECGSFPDPDNLVRDKANWSYFMVWYGDFVRSSTYNPLSLWTKAFNHSYVLTLDEMPNLRTYTGGTSGCGIASNGFPICCNASSDPDGDGWGWENNASCYVQNTGGISNGTYRIIARHSGKSLDVAANSTADGADVTQYTYNGTNNQKWIVQNVGGNAYSIKALHSGKSLDVVNASTADGADINQWTYNAGNNQKWRIESVGGGYYRIVSVNSSKCVDVVGASTADGVQINQYTCSGANNQAFTLQFLSSSTSRIAGEEELQSDLNVYPNPSTSIFTIEEAGVFTFSVKDNLGQVKDSGKGKNKVSFGENLSTGVYIVEVESESGNKVVKIIKN
jgi:mannan endo-1,4-beta-mannosidase